MDEAAQLSDLIGEIYDATLDRGLWPSVLESTCRFINGACAGLVAQDPIADAGQFYFTWGVDPVHERLYLEKYVRLNPTNFALMATTQVGDVGSTETIMSFDEFRASRFYQEWAKPQGYCDAVWTLLEKSATASAALSVLRHERHGLVDDATRQRMRLLAPHFRRAVAIGKLIELHKVEAAALADTLDGIATALFLVTANGRITHTNAAGKTMLAEGKVLRGTGGKLSVIEPTADQALQETFAAASGGDAALGSRGTAVPLIGEVDRSIAHVLPLTAGTRRNAGLFYAATAAVFVRKAELDLPSPMETIAKIYQLTPGELRVLAAIMAVGGMPEVAKVLGISTATARTHLQRIFDKTGTKRQADLVKLLAGLANPLTG